MTIGFIIIMIIKFIIIGLLFIVWSNDDTKKDKYDKYHRDLKRINQIKSTSDAYKTYQANKLGNPHK